MAELSTSFHGVSYIAVKDDNADLKELRDRSDGMRISYLVCPLPLEARNDTVPGRVLQTESLSVR